MKIKIFTISVFLAATTLFSACAATPDPLAFCNKLDKLQIEQLLNSSYTVETLNNLNDKAQGCKIVSDTVEGRSFNIIAHKADYPKITQASYQKATDVWRNSTLPNRTYQDLKDLGDGAFWSYNKNTPQLIAYKETKMLIITLGNFNLTPEEELTIATQIATTLLDQQW